MTQSRQTIKSQFIAYHVIVVKSIYSCDKSRNNIGLFCFDHIFAALFLSDMGSDRDNKHRYSFTAKIAERKTNLVLG